MNRPLLAAAACAALGAAVALPPQPAQAAFKVRKLTVNHVTRAVPRVVVQYDGRRWRATANPVIFPLYIYARVGAGQTINAIVVWVPNKGGGHWTAYTRAAGERRSGRRVRVRRTERTFPGNRLGYISRRAVQICRAEGRRRHGSFHVPFDFGFQVEIVGHGLTDSNYRSRLFSRSMRGKIVCQRLSPAKAKPQRTAPTPRRTAPSLRVSRVSLSFLHLRNRHACPKKVYQSIVIETNRAGVVHYRLRASNGKKTRIFTARATRGPNGRYRARITRTLTIRKSLAVKFMVEIVGYPKATGWVPLRVRCPRISR